MKSLYTGLACWNVAGLAAFAVLSILQYTRGIMAPHSYQIMAVFAAVFCCIAHSLVVVHFIGTMKWIQQSGPTAGLDETETKPLRRAWIGGAMFPLLVTCMLLAVAVAIMSGGTHVGSLPAWLPVTVAILSIPLNILVIPLARKKLEGTVKRMDSLEHRMTTRIRAGLVNEADNEELLPESGRAGGKVLMFLALNVWVLYGYFRFVLRRHDVSWLPYAIASITLFAIGLFMFRGGKETESLD